MLPDGQHTLKLVAKDNYGNVSGNYEFTFTLDTTTPTPILSLVLSSDTGISQSDRITNDLTPTITGNGEVGAIVQLFNGTQVVGQTTVDTSGIWLLTTSELTDGVKSLSAIASDIAGNTSTSTPIGITVDTLLPQLTLTTPIESSPLQPGAKLTGNINGTGSPLTAFSYRFNLGTEIPINFNAAGTFDQNLDFTGLNSGNYTLTITAIDTAGNILTNQYNVTINLDIAAPVIMAALVRDTAANGATNLDKITFDPSIIGSVVDASQVAEFKAGFDNTPVANFINVLPQRNTDGTFSFTRTQLETIYGGTLADGIRTLRLIAKDAEGNQSDVYSFSFTLDTATPTPSNLDLPASKDTGVSNADNITKNAAPTITGNAEIGATVKLINNADGLLIGQTIVSASGIWQIDVNNLVNGIYNLSAIAFDIAGNVSTPSTPFTITIDSVAPTLTLTTPIDTTPLNQGARFVGSANGTGSGIAEISYRFNSGTEVPLVVSSNGTNAAFNQQLDLTGLPNGNHILTVTTTDVAGNIFTKQYNVTVNIDTEAPIITASLVRDTAANGNATNSDRITNNPAITGTVSDANRVVELKAGLNNTAINSFVDITAQIQPNGSFILDNSALATIYNATNSGNNSNNLIPDGTYTLHLVAKDEFGNTPPTKEYTFTLDTTTPAPTNLDLPASIDSGVSPTDNITNFNTPTITGNAEANSTVQLFNNGNVVGEATSNASGVWQIVTSDLTDGTYNLNAQATDIAGNVSSISTPIQLIIDRALPQLNLTTPIDNAPLADYAVLTGNVDGTGSGISSLNYRFDNSSEVSVTLDNTGNFNQQLDLTALTSGSHVLTLVATDIAGNVKTISYNVTINNDTIAPLITAGLKNDTAPSGTINSNPNDEKLSDRITYDPSITGFVTDTSSIASFKAGFNNQTAANFVDVFAQLNTDGSFNFNRTQLEAIYGGTIPDGAHTLRLIASDSYGNTSNAFSFTFTLDTNIAQPTFNLDAASDSGTVGDKKTKFNTVTLTGLTEPGAILILEQTGANGATSPVLGQNGTPLTVTGDNTGKYNFTNVSLAAGNNTFTVRATDIAGNTSNFSTTIYRFSAPTAINLTHNTVAENSAVGTVIGELSSIDSDSGDTHTYTLVDNAGGRFQIVDNKLQVANSTLLDFEANTQHTVIIRSTDKNGLILDKTQAIAITNVNEVPIFTSTPNNTTVESGSTFTYNITTTDPDAGDIRTLNAVGLPTWLTFTDNGNGTATITGTPNQNQLGLFNIAITATDGGGLKATQNIIIDSQITLSEQTNFSPKRNFGLTIPVTPSILTFKIDPSFDLSDTKFINDAFEVALVDANGISLVHAIGKGRDAFFNLTEGEPVGNGAGATYNPTTKMVSLNLTGVKPGSAELIFRLVNDDKDTATSVRITDFALVAAPAGTVAATQTQFATEIRPNAAPNFNALVDVSNSLTAQYQRSSFNADTKTLYADIAVRNIGSYSVDVPVLVAVRNISDPSVILRNPDGVTPDGIPYYDFTSLVASGKLNPQGETSSRSLAFYNPNGVQFTYDVVVLAQLNVKPVIESKPVVEVIGGQQYRYSVKATDPNGDSVTYKLLTSPEGMTIEENTGLISWNTLSSNKGNQSVFVEVSDGRGGVATQDFILSVIEAPPNRPPVFVTNPKTDARINTQYTYTARATDADNDNLTYSLIEAPTGMTVDSSTGVVSWKPNGNQLDTYDVILAVSDAKGGTTQQTFKVQTQIEKGNKAPIIISDPVTKVYHPTSAFDGVVFGLKSEYPGGSTHSHPPTKLFSFDVDGSNFRDIGGVTINGELVDADGLAIAQKYGLLGFALSEAGSTMIEINPETATATVIGTTLVGRQIRGAVFDLDDNLWVVDSSSSKLLNLNPTSGSILKSVPLTLDGQNFRLSDGTDIAIDGQGKFYLTAYPENDLGAVIYTLDPTTGVLTNVALDPWQYLGGITFADEDNSNHLFGYEINYEDEIYSYDVNANYDRTVLFPNIIPEFNAGGGDLAAIVRKPRYSYTVKALDSDNDSLTYELVTAPTGMKINSSTGFLSWANPVESAIPYDVTVRVQDGRGGVDTQSFKLDTLTLDMSQIGGQVYVDDGQPLNRLVYFNDFEDPNRSNNEWSNPLRDTTPVGDRNFLGRYGGKLYPENFQKTKLSLNDLPEHETVTVSFKLFVNGSWGGSLGAFAPDTWRLNVETGPTLLYTTFGSGYPDSGLPFRLPQAYPENFDDNNPGWYLYPGGTGAVEFNTLGYYLTDNWGDAVYNLSFTFEHGGGNLALDFIGGTDEDINNESWGLDDVEVSVGRQPKTLSNWSVYLDSNNNNKRDLDEISTFTDEKGNYSFIVAPGNYTVATEIQPGWSQVQPTNSNYQVTVNNNQAITNLNFGNRSSVTGSVAPSFLNTPPTKAMVGQKFNYRAVATDLNGDILSYDLVVKPTGMVIDSKTGLVSWLPETSQLGTQNVIVRVLDSNGGVTLQPFQVEVSPFNTAPKFTNNLIANNFEDLIAGVGKAVSYQFTAIDAEGDTITYSLKQKPSGVTLDSTTGVLSWTPSDSQIGLNNLLVTASDGKGGETIRPFDIRVNSSFSNSNPVISSTPRQTIAFGQNYFYSVIANDPNFDPLTISLENAPTGMIIDNQGRIFWNANKLGSNPVTIKVDDGQGGVTRQSFNIDVVSTTAKLNSAPLITSVPDTVVTNVGREYQYNLIGTDPDNDLLLWSLDTAPQGMAIDATTGALVWKPTVNQIGEHTVAVRLTDALGQFVGTEFNLTVTAVNAAPIIVSTPITIAAQNQQYSYTVVATDSENDVLTYSLDSTSLSKGITIDSNGRIVWTPLSNQVGYNALSVTVSDTVGASNSQTFAIEVGTTAINNAPTITSTPKFVASVGSPYQYQVVATDPDTGDTLTYQVLSKPSGVDVQINPTTGLLTWDNPTSGQYQIVVGAVDSSGLGAAQGFILTARNNSNPVINSTAPSNVTPGSIYAYDVKATDADGDNLTYTIDQTSRNLGITLDDLGRLRWSPTSGNVGTHNIILTVSDGNGGSQQQQYDLVVAGDTVAPKVSLIATYDTVNLGESVTFQAKATDNVKVAGLQLLINNSPVVIDANGLATFTPTVAGTINARAIATDTAGNVGQSTFNVVVVDTSDVSAPIVNFNLVGVTDGFVTAPSKIKATITDDGQLDYYRLLVAPVNGGEFKEIWRNDNPTVISDGELVEKFDPSLLQNDSYILRLEVADNGGHISYSEQVVDVAGELKLGNFRLSFTDLTVPVTGIPITLTRTYDTLTSSEFDDFGYGWRMEFRDTDLRTSLRTPSEEDQLTLFCHSGSSIIRYKC